MLVNVFLVAGKLLQEDWSKVYEEAGKCIPWQSTSAEVLEECRAGCRHALIGRLSMLLPLLLICSARRMRFCISLGVLKLHLRHSHQQCRQILEQRRQCLAKWHARRAPWKAWSLPCCGRSHFSCCRCCTLISTDSGPRCGEHVKPDGLGTLIEKLEIRECCQGKGAKITIIVTILQLKSTPIQLTDEDFCASLVNCLKGHFWC
mmetsp:Transcript_142777/g.266175  ORF Transcript_142777/g.266175 Transcript_142777/m.266175 type:complete len:204 (+) Transcript_142777:377-988(+)